jgi:hypothetical protein
MFRPFYCLTSEDEFHCINRGTGACLEYLLKNGALVTTYAVFH